MESECEMLWLQHFLSCDSITWADIIDLGIVKRWDHCYEIPLGKSAEK